MTERVAVVVPAYNEEQMIGNVLRDLRNRGFETLIVVDDGSTDRTGAIARGLGAVVVRHVINRGLGGALGTGLKAALRFDVDAIVTFDADGQHDPADIPALVEPIRSGRADVVIGTRRMGRGSVPLSRRVAHRVANLITRVLFGVWTTDSQSGLRAFSPAAVARLHLVTSGMEVSSEIVAESARQRLRVAETPIRAIYTAYSLSKGQSFAVGLRTLAKLLLARVRRPTR